LKKLFFCNQPILNTMFALALTVMMPLSALADSTQVTAEGVRRRGHRMHKCTKTWKAACKQSCPPGWEHVGTSDYGCCLFWWSCAGSRKTCELDYWSYSHECSRRRSEDESIEEADDLAEFMSFLENVDGHWVQLSSPSADDGVAGRFLEAGLRESESTLEVDSASPEPEFMSTTEETGTKRFVLEDGEWVPLSKEEENGMSTTVSEEADEVVSEVNDGARRRWGWPGSRPGPPSGFPKICKEEKEMPCNLPCLGTWSLVRTIENGCCMRRPGYHPLPTHCGGHTNVCKKVYLC